MSDHPDLLQSKEWLHLLDQLSVTTRQTAQILGMFRSQLLDEGFTEQGAENLTDTFAIAVLSRE